MGMVCRQPSSMHLYFQLADVIGMVSRPWSGLLGCWRALLAALCWQSAATQWLSKGIQTSGS